MRVQDIPIHFDNRKFREAVRHFPLQTFVRRYNVKPVEKQEETDKRLTHLETEMTRLEEEIKERETSFFRAARTFLLDAFAYTSGKRKEIPTSAILGLIYSYMRPRIIIILGSIAAVFFAGAQIILLWQQNRLIERQEVFLRAQTKASQLQAISFLLASLDPKDPVKTGIAISQLAQYGDYAVPALLRLTDMLSAADPVSLLAQNALFEQASIHSVEQVHATIAAWNNRLSSWYLDRGTETSGDYALTGGDKYLMHLQYRVVRDSGFRASLLQGRDAADVVAEIFGPLYLNLLRILEEKVRGSSVGARGVSASIFVLYCVLRTGKDLDSTKSVTWPPLPTLEAVATAQKGGKQTFAKFLRNAGDPFVR